MAKQAQIDEVRPVLTAVDKDITTVEQALDAIDKGADKMASVVESGLEATADVIPEAIDTSVHVVTGGTRRFVGAFRSPKVLALAVVLIGAGAGAGLGIIGYKLAMRKLQKEFDERLEAEIEGMRAFYERKHKAGSFATPGEAAEALGVAEAVEALKDYETPPGEEEISREEMIALRERLRRGGTDEDAGAEAKVKEERGNIFLDGSTVANWDLERELLLREAQPDAPYVVSQDEYMLGGKGYNQMTMTYFEKDDILADEREVPVEEVEATVGNDNLSRFGHGSNDVNIVYVRNDRIELDIEIVRSTGAFSEEVTGFIEHSDRPRGRDARGRFRRGEDE